MKRGKGEGARKVFRAAIEAAEHLGVKEGLLAIEESGAVVTKNARSVLGSVNIDGDCRAAFPNHNRWDYAIGIERAAKAIAVFVEVHSAETSEVSKMEKKLQWLLEFLGRPKQFALKSIPREIHWVASGRINIPKHLPHYKRLRTTLRGRGLLGPVKQLELA